jgi:hypothetical protein
VDTPTADSLLDETNFLAELVNLEDGLTLKRRDYQPIPDVLTPVRATPHGKFPESASHADEPEVDDDPTIAGYIAAASMFMLMVGVGAAGAALVFHERVVRILAAW